MKRLITAAIAAMFYSAPALAQPLPHTDGAVLTTLKELRAQYPTPMTSEQLAELLNRTAWRHREQGWKLLWKDGGSRCLSVRHGFSTSCDILVHAPTRWHFDVLRDGEGAAEPVWIDAGACELGPTSGCEMSRAVDPVDPGGDPVPPPPSDPHPEPPAPAPPSTDPALLERIAALERAIAALAAEIQRLIEKPAPPAPAIVFPDYTGRVFGSPVTLRPVKR